jgi:hypothetical protein
MSSAAMSTARTYWVCVTLWLPATSWQTDAEACAPAPRVGDFIQIADETAIIAWDAEKHVEHFVRRASFRTQGKDFGFLVPTPSRPELAEVPDTLFWDLERLTAPRVEVRRHFTGIDFMPFLLGLTLVSSRSAAPMVEATADPVRVLDEKRVGGYDAVVLEADDPKALADWLDGHGYDRRPTLVDWLASYVERKWKITAFKIAPPEIGAVQTAAVRMSFSAERPFFPYREPADQRAIGAEPLTRRRLRIFYLGSERSEAAIGTNGKWPGITKWAAEVDGAAIPEPSFGLRSKVWLTAFDDESSPRPGTDELFFAPAAIRTPMIPVVVVNEGERFPIPLDVVLGLGGAIVWFWSRRNRRLAATR